GAGLLAAAKQDFLVVSLGGVGQGLEPGALVGAVAEGLAFGAAATAPVVGAAAFQFLIEGLRGGNFGLQHGVLAKQRGRVVPRPPFISRSFRGHGIRTAWRYRPPW